MRGRRFEMTVLLWVWSGCEPAATGPGISTDETSLPPPTDPTPLPTDDTPPLTTGTTSPGGGTTGTTIPKVDPCGPDPGVTVTAATATEGRLKNQFVIDVTTSAEAAVAVRCTSYEDPRDIHLVEDAGGTTTHTFDLGGLLAADHYDCVAAAICPQSLAPPVAFGFDTGLPPAALDKVSVVIDPNVGMTGAYTMANIEKCGGSAFDWLQLVDPDGRNRWWHPFSTAPNVGIEARHHGDGLIVWAGGYTSEGRPRQVDVFDGEIYDSADGFPDWASTIFHHDGKQLEDGRIMTLETETTFREGQAFEGFAVRVMDPVLNTVEWEYTSQIAVDAGELDAGSAYGDVWHANWADVRVENGVDKLYISLCYYYQVIKVDPVAGSIEWTFGPGGDFSLVDVNGNALADIEYSSCQHGLEATEDKLLVYDNGWSRSQSRIAEYDIDDTTMTATLLWTWTDGWYICCLGDADWLSNGRVLLEQATFTCGSSSEVIEIDPATGAVASVVTFPSGDGSYRAERLDGCELFANAAYCEDLATRVAELAPIFDGTGTTKTP